MQSSAKKELNQITTVHSALAGLAAKENIFFTWKMLYFIWNMTCTHKRTNITFRIFLQTNYILQLLNKLGNTHWVLYTSQKQRKINLFGLSHYRRLNYFTVCTYCLTHRFLLFMPSEHFIHDKVKLRKSSTTLEMAVTMLTCSISSSCVTLTKFSNTSTPEDAAITWQFTRPDRKWTCWTTKMWFY